jgi:hypothetical protein
MALIPRKEEYEAVLRVIGPTDAELAEMPADERREVMASATAMAKEVVKVAWECLRRRKWYALIHRYGGAQLVFGPESSAANAEKWAVNNLNGGSASVFEIHPTGAHADWLAEQQEEWDRRRDNVCADCGHQQWAHELTSFSGKKIYRPDKLKFMCGTSCTCREFRKAVATAA